MHTTCVLEAVSLVFVEEEIAVVVLGMTVGCMDDDNKITDGIESRFVGWHQ